MYLDSNDKTVKSAKFQIQLADRTEILPDDSFPFEFSLPLTENESTIQLKFEAIDDAGTSRFAEAQLGVNAILKREQ